MEWFIEHATLIANAASMAMLFVWLFYTVLFYRDFRQQRMPLIVIHQALGHDLDSTCLLVNMSKQPIHVLCVMMVAHVDDSEIVTQITNTKRISPEESSHKKVQDFIKQGPLPTGYFLHLGSFREMMKSAGLVPATELALDDAGRSEPIRLSRPVRYIEVRIIALHGAYQDPIGAYRSFRVCKGETGLSFAPDMLLTKQMASRRERYRVRRWLKSCLPVTA